ncbi:MAG: hypothetical protein Fur005_06260 [Roseiflexaceae bacterium]
MIVTTYSALASEIASKAAACDEFEVLQAPAIGAGDWKNELVLFVKPEAFMVSEQEQTAKIVDLVLARLAAFDAHVAGVALIGGAALDRLEIMSAHYGLINRLSRTASTALNDEDRAKIAAALSIDLGEYRILGGHEYLAAYPGETSKDLDKLWFDGRSTKIRSGFYVKPAVKGSEKLVLVNAFHPEQLAHFTSPTHRIALMLIHSNSSWSALKNTMVGATFPDKADPDSIRGTLHRNPADYGFESVTIANNTVHLSAGPFEGLFEINNFFGKLMQVDPAVTQPRAVKQMVAAGLSVEQALGALQNPIVTEDPKPTDLFSATEDADTDAAIAVYQAYLAK